MILTETEVKTKYDGVFMYVAPEGYKFWSEGTCYGKVVYGGDCLTNYYYLKEDETNTEKNSK